VGIVTFHEFPIFFSTMELFLFLFWGIDESNDNFVPIFAASSPSKLKISCHNGLDEKTSTIGIKFTTIT